METFLLKEHEKTRNSMARWVFNLEIKIGGKGGVGGGSKVV